MKKIIRLTENDLLKLVKKVIKEDEMLGNKQPIIEKIVYSKNGGTLRVTNVDKVKKIIVSSVSMNYLLSFAKERSFEYPKTVYNLIDDENTNLPNTFQISYSAIMNSGRENSISFKQKTPDINNSNGDYFTAQALYNEESNILYVCFEIEEGLDSRYSTDMLTQTITVLFPPKIYRGGKYEMNNETCQF